ncbi:NAD-dependent protein deacetylase hst1 [Escovopsis weberi]|uniref:NAD-dependent protein deacetylase hst1 n=1 Tax=Escovopsis weberi TaxID=150374 RepID=A0A0M8N8Q3_ESCWE|nr:NAD-dependent protein deacetylase hst1 [Escovopsis weberi]
MKRSAAGKTAAPARERARSDAFDDLSANPTIEEIREASVNASLAELEDRVADTRDSWETDSLFEDIIDELANEDSGPCSGGPDACSPEEACRLRRELREQGPAVFCQRTVDAGRYTARKLLSAFGIRPPAFLDGGPDEAYYGLLSLAITRELEKRAKLPQHNTVDDAVRLIQRSSNIIVITGAGISTSLGIPDFRSKDVGLYAKLGHLGLSDPQEVFDIALFREDPAIFYSVARDIIPSTSRFTPTHRFLAMLHERGKLLTNYSQNIDNLEVKAGLPADKLIHCHGSFGTATCMRCGFHAPGESIFPDIRAGKIPRCTKCIDALAAATAAAAAAAAKPQPSPPAGKRKRPAANGTVGPDPKKRRRRNSRSSPSPSLSPSDDDDDDAASAVGVMKPDIVFFGENLPDEFSKRLTENDRDKVDLVIVIGTSLKVTPVSEIVSWLPPHIPQIYLSRQAVSHINFDIDLLGDCDVIVAELCRRLGWDLVHEMVPEGQEVDVTTEEPFKSRHAFTVRK